MGRKALMKRGNAIFTFTLKNAKGETASWYIDLKHTGEVGKGTAPAGKDSDGMPTRSGPRLGQNTCASPLPFPHIARPDSLIAVILEPKLTIW